MSNNPYAAGSAQAYPPQKTGPSSHPMEPLHAAAGWIIFMGWVFIVIGVLYCLTIIGLLFGWLPIWMGILLKGAGEKLQQGFRMGNQAELFLASKNLGTYFIIMGILTLIGVVINALYLIFVVVMLIGIAGGAAAGM